MEVIKQGRVIQIISNLFIVEIDNQLVECISRGIFKTREEKPVVGDNVKVKVEENQFTIIEVFNRRQYCKRPKMANITQLLCVVSSKHPTADLLMLDKQLAFAEYLQIKPVIIINKTDLDEEMAQNINSIYTKVGYPVIMTSAKNQKNIDPIKKNLRGNISAFSGNSGVGKSTLINNLLKQEVTLEGEISQKNKKGKNTTTSVKLYKLEEDTYIADTPGFSTFDIYEISSKELYHYFKEFEQYADHCEYQDCTHLKEKKCGIQEEVGKGISKSRYQNFKKIYEELKDKEAHQW